MLNMIGPELTNIAANSARFAPKWATLAPNVGCVSVGLTLIGITDDGLPTSPRSANNGARTQKGNRPKVGWQARVWTPIIATSMI